MILKRLSMISVCLLVAACGGEEGDPAAEPTAYADMSFEQREAFMMEVVLPKMKGIFVAFDPKFEAMSCVTCHGSGATDGTYAMPSADVPALPTEEEFPEWVKDPEHAHWSEFMFNEVMPEMASLLQVDVYDPEKSPNGFSCAGCHTVESQL